MNKNININITEIDLPQLQLIELGNNVFRSDMRNGIISQENSSFLFNNKLVMKSIVKNQYVN